jgi:hypothetical protein
MRTKKQKNKMSDYIKLESLPNEIFIEIFDYLSLYHLYKSFKGLNQRINGILQSLNNRAIRLWSTNKNDEIEMNNFFSSTIVSLDINDEYNVNLNQFPKIHSLNYINATDNQIQHFLQSKFCHKYLKYLNITSEDLSLLITYFFSNQFPSLHHCILCNIDPILLTCPWRITPSFSSITICNDENLIPLILKSCPNLKHLSLSIFQYSNTPSSLCVYHPHLKHLSIEMIEPGWTVEMIERLFSSIQTPDLISFRIASYQPSLISFDFVQLIDIFDKQIPNLQQFECNILLLKGMEIMDLKNLRDLHGFLFNHLKFENQSEDILRIYTSNYQD